MRITLPGNRLLATPVTVALVGIAALAAASALAAGAPKHTRKPPPKPPPITRTSYALANGCFALQSVASGAFVTPVFAPSPSGTAPVKTGYAATSPAQAGAASFFLKATGLGTYLLSDPAGSMLSISGARIVPAATAGPRSEWAIVAPVQQGTALELRSTARGQLLMNVGGTLTLEAGARADRRAWFTLHPVGGCTAFPEAQVNATGRTFSRHES